MRWGRVPVLLLVISGLLLAFPLAASAGSPVMDRSEPTSPLVFTGTFGISALVGEGVPAINCFGPNHVTGAFTTGSGTAGTIALDYTKCSMNIMGIVMACKSKGAAEISTIAMPETPFELVYLKDDKTQPGILIKNILTEITCGSGINFTIWGDLMGTISSPAPACGKTFKEMTLRFESTGGLVQDQQQVTGTGATHDLKVLGLSGERTFALNMTTPLTLSQAATLTCV